MAERRHRPAPNVEGAALAAGIASALRRAGLPSSPDRATRLSRALRLAPPTSVDALYWTCRVVFVTDRDQLDLFDAVFAEIFAGTNDPAEGRGDPNAPQIPAQAPAQPTPRDHRPEAPSPQDWSGDPAPTLSTGGGDEESRDSKRDALLAAASTEERLHDTSFALLTPDEVLLMQNLVRKLVMSTPLRLSRRTGSSRHGGSVDLRRTVRAAHHTGGDASRLVYAERRARPRQLVLLCDISGSMEPYTRVFLSLLQGAVASARAEAFVFSTRLTRLTRQLATRDPDQALAHAAAHAPDWSGGTRLAESIRSFLDTYGRRGLARGAVVVVLSDGWAQDDPEQVAVQMRRLRLLARTIVWVNPRMSAEGYRPLVGGMAAALPYCDAFVSGHSYAALADVAAAINIDTRSVHGHPAQSQPAQSQPAQSRHPTRSHPTPLQSTNKGHRHAD